MSEYSGIEGMLRFFVELGDFSYVDRIGNALTVEPVEMALRDALRVLRAYWNSAEEIEEGGKKYRFIRVMDRRTREERTYRLPKIPDSEEIERFMSAVREDISEARRVAINSLSYK